MVACKHSMERESQKRRGLADAEVLQRLNKSRSVLPIRAGEGDTFIPADSMAAIFDPASPLPPEMIAPA
jgi:hypothetical protein